MPKMTMQEVLQKLEKLRAFAERDCGNETENAIRIINRLCKEYNITFHYKTFAQRQEEDDARKEYEKKIYAERAKQAIEEITESITISHISSKDITIALCRKMKIKYCIKGWKVYVKCSREQLAKFSYVLNRVKSSWKDSNIMLNREIIEKMNDINF